jgi:hypothetical protein
MSDTNESQNDPVETPEAASGTSPADSDHSGESAAPQSSTLGGISDEQLPDDLQPGDDNPLAEPLDPDAEETKDRDELEMDATQEDLGNPPVESSSDAESGESGGDANAGDGAEGSGIAGG